MSEEKVYTTRDRKADTGITINNILLAVVIFGGSLFGTLVNSYLSNLTSSVDKMENAVSSLQSVGSVTANELNHINGKLAECKSFRLSIQQRLTTLESRRNKP